MKRTRSLAVCSILAVMLLTAASYAGSIYAVSVDSTSIYEIDVLTGAVTTATSSASFPSIGLACDGVYGYYWNSQNPGSHRGLVKWNPLTDTHTLINASEISEENATVDASGNIWVLDRSNSYVDGTFIGDNTGILYQIDPVTGDRTGVYTLPDIGGYAVGDIAWGPDGNLYISTNNTFWGYDTNSNYVWNPVTGVLETKTGEYHAGLVWVDGKLYGSKTVGGVGTVFELDPTDFSEIALVATMGSGVTIGDLSNAVNIVPEPATLCLLGLGTIALLKRKKS